MKKLCWIPVAAIVLAICGVCIAQQRPGSAPAVPQLPPTTPAPTIPAVPVAPPVYSDPQPLLPHAPAAYAAPVAPPKPEDLTIDQLADSLETLRAQKAELDKKEQALLKLIKTKADKLKDRLDKLGVGAPPEAAPLPPAAAFPDARSSDE